MPPCSARKNFAGKRQIICGSAGHGRDRAELQKPFPVTGAQGMEKTCADRFEIGIFREDPFRAADLLEASVPVKNQKGKVIHNVRSSAGSHITD